MKWQQELSDEEMQEALESKFLELQPTPTCVVADMMLGWVNDVAAKFHVPCHTLFTMPAKDLAFILRVNEPLKDMTFVIPTPKISFELHFEHDCFRKK